MFRLILKFLWKLSGWKISGSFPFHVNKMVIVVGPHTSAWDFIVGVAVRALLPIENGCFLGKKELFDGSFGWFFRKMGGIPVDRHSKKGLVEQVVQTFRQQDQLRLALSPEGTRKQVQTLRTGFYHIAKGADVPVLLAGLDFKKKTVVLSELIDLTDNEKEDIKKIIQFFQPIQGKHPELGMQHIPIPE
jgi:1-acyl-sn-glycerol-3-phosphate acyltransferase